MELHNCFIKPIARSGCFLTSPKLNAELLAQAKAYRKLAAERAVREGMGHPPSVR